MHFCKVTSWLYLRARARPREGREFFTGRGLDCSLCVVLVSMVINMGLFVKSVVMAHLFDINLGFL